MVARSIEIFDAGRMTGSSIREYIRGSGGRRGS